MPVYMLVNELGCGKKLGVEKNEAGIGCPASGCQSINNLKLARLIYEKNLRTPRVL